MGCIYEGKTFHLETRRESFVLYTNFGEERLELLYQDIGQLEEFIKIAKNRAKEVGLSTTCPQSLTDAP